MKNLKFNLETLRLNLNINYSLNYTKLAKYLFITFIAVLGLVCLIDGMINNNAFLIAS